jgi:hypothetical protein
LKIYFCIDRKVDREVRQEGMGGRERAEDVQQRSNRTTTEAPLNMIYDDEIYFPLRQPNAVDKSIHLEYIIIFFVRTHTHTHTHARGLTCV